MAISIKQLGGTFVGEVSGIDLTRPPDAATAKDIERGLDQYGVLVFRDQALTAAQQLAFAELLGPIELSADGFDPDNHFQAAAGGKIAEISNMGADDQRLDILSLPRMYALAARLWHTDSTFRKYRSRYTMLNCKAIPEKGGQTAFADMHTAYAELPDEVKESVEGVIAEHSLYHTMKTIGIMDQPGGFFDYHLPLVRRPIVHFHPGAKKKSLCVPSHACSIVGMPIPDGRMLLSDLRELVTQPRYCYEHTWKVGDFVIWDDRSTLHRGRPYDDQKYNRKLSRSVVQDTGPEAIGEVVAG